MHHACPHHDEALARHLVANVATWKCGTCDGLWLPGAVVSRVVGRAPHWPVRADTAATALPCPDDGSLLRAVDADGIELDLCPTCHGLWLDRGELADIIARRRDNDMAESLADELVEEISDEVWDGLNGVARRPRTRLARDADGDTPSPGATHAASSHADHASVPRLGSAQANSRTNLFDIERDTRTELARGATSGSDASDFGEGINDLLSGAGDALAAVFEFVAEAFTDL